MQDLTGQIFGKWTVLEFSYRDKRSYWKCQCECGTIKYIQYSNLKYRISPQCKQCFYKSKIQKPIERFNKYWILDIETGCWLWIGGLTTSGYGHFWIKNKMIYAHRFSYEYHNGPIPDRMVIDHLCRVRECVNPNHLEVVTNDENLRRGNHNNQNKNKIHCKNGHEFTPDNIIIDKNGGRHCMECSREYYINNKEIIKERAKKYYYKKKELII